MVSFCFLIHPFVVFMSTCRVPFLLKLFKFNINMKVLEADWDKREETSRREMAEAKRVGAVYGTNKQ